MFIFYRFVVHALVVGFLILVTTVMSLLEPAFRCDLFFLIFLPR